MCQYSSIFQTGGEVSVVVGTIFCLIGTSSTYWVVYTRQANFGHLGLWIGCELIDGADKCDVYTWETNAILAARGCAVACLLLAAAGSVVGLSNAFCNECISSLYAFILNFTAGMFGIAAMGTFGVTSEYRNVMLGWSFGLFCTGIIYLIVGSIIAFLFSSDSPIKGRLFKLNIANTSTDQTKPHSYGSTNSSADCET